MSFVGSIGRCMCVTQFVRSLQLRCVFTLRVSTNLHVWLCLTHGEFIALTMWNFINESISEWCSSPFWDTNLTWNNADPDFTPCFEKTALTWLPCLFLVLFTPLEIYFQRVANSSRTPFNRYNVFKLIIIVMAGVTDLADIANYQFLDDEKRSLVDLYPPIIRFLTSVLFCELTYSSIRSGVRSSGTLFLFTALAVVCGAPEMRTELKMVVFNRTHEIRHHEIVHFTSYTVYYLSSIIVFVLNCYADYLPASRVTPENLCPEKDSSFLSKFVFSWFNDLVWRGYRKPLSNDDLWEMDDDLRTTNVVKKFEFYWRRARDRLSQGRVRRARDGDRGTLIDNEFVREFHDPEEDGKKVSIVFPLCQTFGFQYLHVAMFRLVFSSLLCVSPLILNLILAFVKEEHEFEWRGFLFAVLLLMVAVTRTLFLNQYFHKAFRLGVFMRTSLASVIYKKALRISSGARRNYSTGEINNLMAVDANRFINSMMYISMLWAAPLEVGVAVYLLYDILGVSVFAGLASLALMIPLSAYAAAKSEKLVKKRMEIKDKRVKLMTEILSGIKVLKLYAWEPHFGSQITQIRESEIRTMRFLSFLEAASAFLWTLSPILVCIISFSLYVLTSGGRVLDVRTAFVSFALFNAIRVPLSQLPPAIADLIQTWVSVKRINKFLNAEELDPKATSHEPRSERIVIENGQFSWKGRDGPPTLNNINVTVKAGHLIAVVGAVGAGKSSLLCALLGEMYKQWGSVNTTGTLAYVPQQAWVRNATFKANVTFGASRKGRKFYERVLEACALRADLATLPGGDQAEIGEKGVNLSGGQKQRLSLARAVYSEADTYLLDDPLSAVDAHVGKHIFERVIGPNGMLRKKTRILVTHNISYLSQMDTIVVLKDGTISESGTYETLLQKQGDFANFLATFATEERTTNEVDDEEDDSQLAVSVEDESRLSQNSVLSDEGSAAVEVDGQRLIDEEETEIGGVKFAVYKYYLKAMGLYRVAATILSNMTFIVCTIGSGLWLAEWSTHATVHSQYFYVGIYALLGFSQAFSVFTQVTFLFLSLLKGAKRVHDYLLWAVLRWPALIFDRIPSGRILNQFSADVEILDSTLKTNLQPCLWLTAQVMSTLFLISYSSPKFLVVLVVLAVFYYLFQRFFIASARQLRRLESVSKSPIFSHFEETVVGAQSVRAYKLQTEFIQDFERKVDNSMKSCYLGLVCNRWLSVRLETLGSLITFSAALFAVLGRSTLSAGLVGLSITYAIQVTNNLYQWVRMTAEVETDTVAVERIKKYVDMEQEKPWETPEDHRIPEKWPSWGEIVFSRLQVRYQECLEPVLKGISFRVKSGEKVGIVGRTGAGKSSLTLCMFRIIENCGGEITIDDVDIAKLGLHTLRNRLTIIPQDPILFTGTLRMNLDPTETIPDESLWTALEMVDLKKYMSNHNLGLDYWITEGGGNFSLGQRQLICLGRALLRKSKVLILDEATAAIDMETDALIQITIRNEFRDSTVLTVAHRLNTVLDYDRILVLDTGSIVEYDSPRNLLDNRESVFSKMALDAGLIASDAPNV